MDICKVEAYRGLSSGPTGNLRVFYDRHHGGKHSRQEPGSIPGIVLETNRTKMGDRGCFKITTTGVDRVVVKIPEGRQQLEDQVWETNSPRERPKPWTRVKAMLNWSLGLVLAIICLTDTVDVTMISLQEGCQEILQTKSVERQFMERPLRHYGGEWAIVQGTGQQ